MFGARARPFLRHARLLGTRATATVTPKMSSRLMVMGATGVTMTGVIGLSNIVSAAEASVDYGALRSAIEEILDDENHDDGSWGPILIRLAWHSSGTYNKSDGTGGSSTGASMRFSPESDWGANAGLGAARDRLEQIKEKFPGASYADIYTLAGVVAIESMGGPKIEWTPGRKDCTPSTCPILPDGLLPDGAKDGFAAHGHLRDIFHRMGFNDQEIVALSGAHTLGRCHTTSSGFSGPWTNAPTTFSNLYFKELISNTWTRKIWSGPEQYEDPTGELMMLGTDLALIHDKEFRKWVDVYAADEEKFFQDFSSAMSKLINLGFKPTKPWYQFW